MAVLKIVTACALILLLQIVSAAIHGADCRVSNTCPACYLTNSCPTGAPTPVPNGITTTYSGKYEGCWTDNMNGVRDLPTNVIVNSGSMTVQSCIDACGQQGFQYAAMQYSSYCFCGNAYGTDAMMNFEVDDSQCNMACSGDPYQKCGAGNRNSVYRVQAHQYLGCHADQEVRDFAIMASEDYSTLQQCSRTCLAAGYTYAGMQYKTYCFCGMQYGKYGTSTGCNMKCRNGTATCGGVWANSVVATKWNIHDAYLGCYLDTEVRDFSLYIQAGGSMTIQSCSAQCAALSFSFSAMQYGEHCFCGNTFGTYGRLTDNMCKVPCSGNNKQTCGGGWANQVYDVRGYNA